VFAKPKNTPAILVVERQAEAMEPYAVVHPGTFASRNAADDVHMFARDFPQCVVPCKPDARVRPGSIQLSPRVAYSLQVTFGDTFPFTQWSESADDGFGGDLAAVFLVGGDNASPPALQDRIVTLQEDVEAGFRVEKLVFEHRGERIFRIRGRVTAKTRVEVSNGLPFLAADDLVPGGVSLMSSDEYEVRADASTLMSCLALAKRLVKGESTIHVDVDCCALDRAVLLLQTPDEDVSAEHASEVLHVAKLLGALDLEQRARKTLGEFATRVSVTGVRLDDCRARVARGECIIVVDGAVYDLTRWLPHHPGGSTIIPEQSLVPVDATVFFQVYHASTKSMLFLKHLYVGDLHVNDVDKLLPPPGKGAPSAAFLEVLRSHTAPWRITPKPATAFQSF